MPQEEFHLDSLAPILPHGGAQGSQGTGRLCLSSPAPCAVVGLHAWVSPDRDPRGEVGAHYKTQNPRGSKIACSKVAGSSVAVWVRSASALALLKGTEGLGSEWVRRKITAAVLVCGARRVEGVTTVRALA